MSTLISPHLIYEYDPISICAWNFMTFVRTICCVMSDVCSFGSLIEESPALTVERYWITRGQTKRSTYIPFLPFAGDALPWWPRISGIAHCALTQFTNIIECEIHFLLADNSIKRGGLRPKRMGDSVGQRTYTEEQSKSILYSVYPAGRTFKHTFHTGEALCIASTTRVGYWVGRVRWKPYSESRAEASIIHLSIQIHCSN